VKKQRLFGPDQELIECEPVWFYPGHESRKAENPVCDFVDFGYHEKSSLLNRR
jgi:hypothetical protein